MLLTMISANIKPVPKLTAEIIPPAPTLEAELGGLKIVSGDAELYPGPYTVTPKAFEGTTLATANRLLTNNVTVLEIPYYDVSNQFGNTIFIGSEVMA